MKQVRVLKYSSVGLLAGVLVVGQEIVLYRLSSHMARGDCVRTDSPGAPQARWPSRADPRALQATLPKSTVITARNITFSRRT